MPPGSGVADGGASVGGLCNSPRGMGGLREDLRESVSRKVVRDEAAGRVGNDWDAGPRAGVLSPTGRYETLAYPLFGSRMANLEALSGGSV